MYFRPVFKMPQALSRFNQEFKDDNVPRHMYTTVTNAHLCGGVDFDICNEILRAQFKEYQLSEERAALLSAAHKSICACDFPIVTKVSIYINVDSEDLKLHIPSGHCDINPEDEMQKTGSKSNSWPRTLRFSLAFKRSLDLVSYKGKNT